MQVGLEKRQGFRTPGIPDIVPDVQAFLKNASIQTSGQRRFPDQLSPVPGGGDALEVQEGCEQG